MATSRTRDRPGSKSALVHPSLLGRVVCSHERVSGSEAVRHADDQGQRRGHESARDGQRDGEPHPCLRGLPSLVALSLFPSSLWL